jgi:hypothetical protein
MWNSPLAPLNTEDFHLFYQDIVVGARQEKGSMSQKHFLASPLQPRPYEYQMAMEWKDDHHHAGEGISGACRRCICHRERSEAISRTVEEIASSLRSSQ